MTVRFGWILALVLVSVTGAGPLWAEGPAGQIVITGNGPEQAAMETLARAFEKANPRAYVDFIWHENAKPLELLRSGKAHVAVVGKEEPDLRAVQVAWDGIAIMVNLMNTTKEVTSAQAADLFSGKIKEWSTLGGPDTRVLLIDRPQNSNVRDAFMRQLSIDGKIPSDVEVIKRDEKAINKVVGTLPPNSAVTFIGMRSALLAVSTGVAVRLLPVDRVEPEKPTVKDGRYKLRRPVLLLMPKQEPNLVADAFAAFALSPAGQAILDREGYVPLDSKPSP
jgi:phosphate transport system substrate-binding protein